MTGVAVAEADSDADKVDAMLEERAGLTLCSGELDWLEQGAILNAMSEKNTRNIEAALKKINKNNFAFFNPSQVRICSFTGKNGDGNCHGAAGASSRESSATPLEIRGFSRAPFFVANNPRPAAAAASHLPLPPPPAPTLRARPASGTMSCATAAGPLVALGRSATCTSARRALLATWQWPQARTTAAGACVAGAAQVSLPAPAKLAASALTSHTPPFSLLCLSSSF